MSRGEDLNKLGLFLQSLAPLGPEAMQNLHVDDYIKRLAGSLGIDTNGLIKTQEEKAQEQQQAEQQQMQAMQEQSMGRVQEKLAPEMMKAVTNQQMQQPN